jgi:hypothetical protein
MDRISPEQIKPKSKKKIGTEDGSDVYQVESKGGLFIVARLKKEGGVDVLGMGPHPAVARHIAKAKHAGIAWVQELSKSEGIYSLDVPVSAFAHLLPQYEALTDAHSG